MQKFTFFLVALCIWGCKESKNQQNPNRTKDSIHQEMQDAARDIAGNFSDQSSMRFSSSRIDAFFTKYDSLRTFQNDLNTFYTTRNYAFAWYNDNGLTEHASNLYARLENLPEEGLNINLPYKHQLDSLFNITLSQSTEQKSETEIMLTAMYFF